LLRTDSVIKDLPRLLPICGFYLGASPTPSPRCPLPMSLYLWVGPWPSLASTLRSSPALRLCRFSFGVLYPTALPLSPLPAWFYWPYRLITSPFDPRLQARSRPALIGRASLIWFFGSCAPLLLSPVFPCDFFTFSVFTFLLFLPHPFLVSAIAKGFCLLTPLRSLFFNNSSPFPSLCSSPPALRAAELCPIVWARMLKRPLQTFIYGLMFTSATLGRMSISQT